MLNFFVRHGMIVAKVHEIISYKQSKWLAKYISFKYTKKKLGMNLRDFYRLFKNAFNGTTVEKVRNLLTLEIFRKDDTKKY